MKIYRIIPLLCLLLSGCSYTFLFPPTPTNPPLAASATPTDLVTPTWTSTITPIPPTPTFTDTPTLIYLGPTPTTENLTGTPGSIFSPTPTFTETSAVLTIPPQDSFFVSIKISGDHVYWGSCDSPSVKIMTHIADMSKVHTVTLWLRLENKKTGDATGWGGGAIMNDDGGGNFSYNLTAKSFNHYNEFVDAWGQYQLVASDRSLARIAGSSQFMNSLTVAACP